MDRRWFLKASAAASAALPGLAMGEDKPAALTRIKCATIGAIDAAATRDLYVSALGYAVVDEGPVSKALAIAWGAPKSAGKMSVTLRPPTGEDVFIRAVEIDPVPNYQPMLSLGWNSFEIIVNDLYAFHDDMLKTAFRHIGGPQSLGGAFASIHASQYVGLDGEVLYFNCETGDRAASMLPDPGDRVGRVNIAILAAHDIAKAMSFYESRFSLAALGQFETPIGVIAQAQSLSPETLYGLGLMRLAERGNAIEFDEYPPQFGERTTPSGQLPPGNAMVSFGVESIEPYRAFWLGPAAELGEARVATIRGAAGELIELVQPV